MKLALFCVPAPDVWPESVSVTCAVPVQVPVAVKVQLVGGVYCRLIVQLVGPAADPAG